MYIDFIPIESYSFFFINVIFLTTILSFVNLYYSSFNSKSNITYLKIIAPIVLLFVILYIGLRPLDEVFGDMLTYNYQFNGYVEGAQISSIKDVFFHLFMKFCSTTMSANFFFLVCAMLYVLPLYIACKKWFHVYWFYAFLMLVGSLSFWGYGVNGIRNGIATSLFLLAISREKYIYQILIFLVSIAFHKSMLLPLTAYILTFFNNNNRYYFFFWLFSIPLSLALPDFFQNLFASLIDDNRGAYLLSQTQGDKFSKTGFRWDFLLYSATGVYAGYFFLFKKKINDKLYAKLVNIFLISNAFWVMVIRASFSNRFAYLSWFMLAVVVFYPFLKIAILKNQNKKTAIIMFLYVSFTYVMSFLDK